MLWPDPEPAPVPSAEKVKECCRLIRAARSHWDAHHNAATRMIRKKALAIYRTLSDEEKKRIPQQLLVWLRYRSEKYFGPIRKKKKKPRGESGS